jgi:hypothetical protein
MSNETQTQKPQGPVYPTADQAMERLNEEYEEPIITENPEGPAGYEEEDYYDEDDSGLVGWIRSNWYVIAAALLVLVLAVAIGVKALGGSPDPSDAESSGEPSSAQQASQDPAGGPGAPAMLFPEGPPKNTGIVIEEPVQEKDTYFLKSGEVAWKGKLEATEKGEVLTLEGPTAAQFRRAIETPAGHVDTGTFGRAEPDGPMVHVMYHRSANDTQELTGGTYFLVNGPETLLQGFYHDTRNDNTITRTYNEWNPQDPKAAKSYAVTFKAAPGVPVPALIGWEEPENIPEPEEAG